MKTIWKWVLGILIALIVIAAILLGMRALVDNGYIAGPGMYAWHRGYGFDKSYGFDEWDRPARFDCPRGWDYPHGGMVFFSPFFFLHGLLKLAVFAGLLYGAYWLGTRNARITLDSAPATPPPAPKRGNKTGRKG